MTAPAVRPDLDAGSSRPNPFTDRVHILLIANDQERIGAGRADSIMLLTLDPGAQQLRVLSIPRDTRMFIPGRGVDKVNHAYAFGGARLLNRTLQLFLGFPFQYYVEVSYGGFRQAIDEVGGVDVTSPFPFTYEGQTFAGAMHLNGVQALAFSRMRKLDPDGDFGRERRQQAVVRALLQELGRIPLDNPSRLNAFAERLIPYVRTDLSPARIVKLRALHPYAVQAPATLRMAGQGRMIRGIYYFEVADAERRRLHVALR
ncbi:cell envelope-related transcriptional attenuator [Deinococcus maricopensis DSM 21211]|uniref:Cell envelope-related transcriptional attenuator n=1 Tax=Deinococcus maricopensis (strain DSM 21211 / LMG 22137 / NRRL B-23946 / LB-34) TaxID=709986 RepID=E8U8C2_DEIML|nr:cell envelope-related transcriptional attenuator [Deinococcus maricopensis DSM 21211]